MSSPSIVRVAGPKDYDEVWRLLMASYAENALFTLAEDKVRWFLNRIIYPETIPPDDTGTRGVIGVIGPVGDLEGLVFITIGTYWYTYDKNLEEYMVYVDSRHRRSEHAKALVKWMASQVEATGLPLVTGILSTHRTEAKCRLYQRMMPKMGEFFVVFPKSSQSSIPALSMVSS
jgi:GNAT superfamily N-acetyltransferase